MSALTWKDGDVEEKGLAAYRRADGNSGLVGGGYNWISSKSWVEWQGPCK